MRFALLAAPLLFVACKGGPAEDTDEVDCTQVGTVKLATLSVPEWPPGMAEAVEAYEGLEGSWTAEACGEPINVVIRTIADSADIDVVTTPLPAPNDCGCTHDPANPSDDALDPIGYTEIDLAVSGYPHPGFSEENAGNVQNVPVALFADPGMRVRGCINHLVPPILLLDFTDNLITIRTGSSGVSGNVSLTGDGVSPSTCTLTNWVRTGGVP